MKLTLILDADPAGVCASLVEEWDGPGGAVRMAPLVRVFEVEEEAFDWGRTLARRRGVARLYLTDNRKSARR
ncbi:MAG TPA: hypothetical protein VGF07_10390 [Stellaceae bacterium]|jgi:nitrous oxide reductase accessory protein NosL